MEDGDAVVLINFRADRMVQMSKAFEYDNFANFDRVRFPKVRRSAGAQAGRAARRLGGAGLRQRLPGPLGEARWCRRGAASARLRPPAAHLFPTSARLGSTAPPLTAPSPLPSRAHRCCLWA